MVIREQYPTAYGRNPPASEKDLLRQTDVDVYHLNGVKNGDPETDPPFPTLQQASQFARALREDEGYFTDYSSLVPDCDADPDRTCWDSADLKNTANDEEVRISVMTVNDFPIKMAKHMKTLYG